MIPFRKILTKIYQTFENNIFFIDYEVSLVNSVYYNRTVVCIRNIGTSIHINTTKCLIFKYSILGNNITPTIKFGLYNFMYRRRNDGLQDEMIKIREKMEARKKRRRIEKRGHDVLLPK